MVAELSMEVRPLSPGDVLEVVVAVMERLVGENAANRGRGTLLFSLRVVLEELVAVLVLFSNLLFSVSMPSGGLSVDFYLVHMVFFPWPRLA